ncbi:hypothetical protein CYPRO_2474 [Cyclonatronum proteinivorum]|uniref:ATP-grasp domain-containing protein n=1 Tax=Cyclonatronum proteinivorum TaxID=1457365 RepID=A0A345UML4_9BACT|nr:hypothetical protein [Cyclonatronum proteinivorum]AXJ01716.1 hypothetical protein CYPRO_2474 [Cyclonatronum proteinivorum]
MKIAIHQNKKVYDHSTQWMYEWIRYCEENKLTYEIVDAYANGFLEKIRGFDVFLWSFSNYSLQDMQFARSILHAASEAGVRVFPDFSTGWHFDDKIAEYYWLQAAHAPVPESWVFYTREDALLWASQEANWPVVAKLKTGSGSNNVKMIRSAGQAKSYINRMFSRGFRNVPGVLFKTASNVKSSRNWETVVKRFKRIPDFIGTWQRARMLPKERGYVLFQEFIPNDGYDLKVAVVGDKLSFFARHIRKGDFRASGGADFYYDQSLMTDQIRETAFEVAQQLRFQSMGFDFVVDKQTGQGKIIEMSYGFSWQALLGAGGYWDREHNWHDEPLNAPVEALKNLIQAGDQA